MKKALTIALLTAATVAALPLTAVADGDSDGAPPPYFVRGPRIIHVPQPDESNERVEYRAKIRADLGDREETNQFHRRSDEAVAPQPRRHATKPEHRRADLPARRKPFSASPPLAPVGPPRAVLSAPPPRIGELAPIYPTPRFEAKAAVNEKSAPFETEVTAKAPPAAPSEPGESNDR
jgi:hypothetical protein